MTDLRLILQLVITWDEAAPRMVSKIGEKITSYSECHSIFMIKPFVVAFNVFIGGTDGRRLEYIVKLCAAHAGISQIPAALAASVEAPWSPLLGPLSLEAR